MSPRPRVLDISPLVTERIAVFPGDTSYRRQVAMDWDHGHHLEVSSIVSTVHLGAHADAPVHYHREGRDMASMPLHPYLGAAEVFRVALDSPRPIRVEDFAGGVPSTPRVLLATGTFPDPDAWRDDFASLAPGTVDWLADHGVVLVGIDTPSVDPADSKELPAHQRLFARGVVNLEGLVLDGVAPGRYTLVALPLRLAGADGSPVRAVLVDGDPSRL